MISVFVTLVLTLHTCLRSRARLHLELLALRHQVQVLERSRRSRPRLSRADRLLWVWLSRVWTGWRRALVIVKPETVIAWHRRGFRVLWTWKSRHRTGIRGANCSLIVHCSLLRPNGDMPTPTCRVFCGSHRQTEFPSGLFLRPIQRDESIDPLAGMKP